jgi:divalent metal cation (Fe/Co/Zn/Cd) transporter
VRGVQDVHEVRARWVGHKIHADLHITVEPELSVAESHAIAEQVHRQLATHVPAFGRATIHVCPDEAAATAG